MGAGQSKEELVYQEVQNGNLDAVKSLRRDGASLEWVDKEGRTPLVLACTRGELLDMATTLLNLGANINAYRPGSHGGFPLHHAAKRGLEKTVTLLLSRGADPLCINDDGQTPLEMARSRGHVSVVRLLEERLCLFSGMLRELSGFGILETFAPDLVTKKVWVVVLPIPSHPRRPSKYELAIYEQPKVAQPRTLISLAKAEIEEPQFSSPDPVLYIMDKTHKAKYKFLSENKGDKTQLQSFYEACRVSQTEVPVNHSLPTAGYQLGNPSQIHPASSQPSGVASLGRQPVLQSVSVPSAKISSPAKLNPPGAEPIPEELALALALDESIRTATQEGVPLSPQLPNSSRVNDYKGWDVRNETYKGWGPPDTNGQQEKPKETSYGGWETEKNTYNGWGPAEAGPSRPQNVPSNGESAAAPIAPPSAPPLPICYPSVEDDSLTGSQYKIVPNANTAADDKTGGTCVVCWDAPAEGACVPCGHLAGCMSCLSEIKAKNWGCPVCRGQIEQVVKVYAV